MSFMYPLYEMWNERQIYNRIQSIQNSLINNNDEVDLHDSIGITTGNSKFIYLATQKWQFFQIRFLPDGHVVSTGFFFIFFFLFYCSKWMD